MAHRDGSVTRGTITPQNAVGLVLAASRFLVPAVQQRAEEVIANNLGTIYSYDTSF